MCFGALAFYPRGELLVGTLVITFFVFSDTLDGIMARSTGRSGNWGAYLDSTLDRVGDAAIFGGLVLYFAGAGRQEGELAPVMAGPAPGCLLPGTALSDAKPRARGAAGPADGGLAGRAHRPRAVPTPPRLTRRLSPPRRLPSRRPASPRLAVPPAAPPIASSTPCTASAMSSASTNVAAAATGFRSISVDCPTVSTATARCCTSRSR